jgi:hypothetical protein
VVSDRISGFFFTIKFILILWLLFSHFLSLLLQKYWSGQTFCHTKTISIFYQWLSVTPISNLSHLTACTWQDFRSPFCFNDLSPFHHVIICSYLVSRLLKSCGSQFESYNSSQFTYNTMHLTKKTSVGWVGWISYVHKSCDSVAIWFDFTSQLK